MKNGDMGNRSKSKKFLMGKLAEEWQEILWSGFVDKMSKIKSSKELQGILESLLSEDEKKMMLRRLATAVLVREGKSYKEIGRILWISPATISAIKKNLLSKNGHHKSHSAIYGKKIQSSVSNLPIYKKTLSDKISIFIESLAE